MKKSIYFLLFALFSFAILSSCRRDKDDPDDNDTLAVEDQSLADAEAGKAYEAIDRTLRGSSNKTGEASEDRFLPDCAVVTVDTLSMPRKVTIDFGTTGCVCSNWDGKTRKGKIIATYTGRYIDAGTVITWSTENYFVDNNEYRISKTVENKGKNQAGQPYFNITASNSVVTPSGTITWQSSRVRTWTKGYDTPNVGWDDEYSISEITPATGKNRKGVGYVVRITKPIVWRASCAFKLVGGELELTVEDKTNKRTINYGNGNCDRQYQVTIKGRTYTIRW
jgi:hypothetical protein